MPHHVRRSITKNQPIDAGLSRKLCKVLRHLADSEGIEGHPSKKGYYNLESVLQLGSFSCYTREHVEKLISRQQRAGKCRYDLMTCGPKTYIKAIQGHSKNIAIHDDALFEPIDPEEFGPGGKDCIHGTKLENWWSIHTEGLNSMRRQHVHFADSAEAIKHKYDVWIYLDMAKACRNGGIKFVRTSTNVVLTRETVSPEFFSKVFLRGKDNTWYEWQETSWSWRGIAPAGYGSGWIVWSQRERTWKAHGRTSSWNASTSASSWDDW